MARCPPGDLEWRRPVEATRRVRDKGLMWVEEIEASLPPCEICTESSYMELRRIEDREGV
jgi:hypothetical protein